jgi:hypothetical protein
MYQYFSGVTGEYQGKHLSQRKTCFLLQQVVGGDVCYFPRAEKTIQGKRQKESHPRATPCLVQTQLLRTRSGYQKTIGKEDTEEREGERKKKRVRSAEHSPP